MRAGIRYVVSRFLPPLTYWLLAIGHWLLSSRYERVATLGSFHPQPKRPLP